MVGLVGSAIVKGIIAAAAVASVVTTSLDASKERKQQRSIIGAERERIAAAEAKAAQAETLSAQAAESKIKQRRLAQTKTILTSPLGVLTEPLVGKKTLTLG